MSFAVLFDEFLYVGSEQVFVSHKVFEPHIFLLRAVGEHYDKRGQCFDAESGVGLGTVISIDA